MSQPSRMRVETARCRLSTIVRDHGEAGFAPDQSHVEDI